MTQITKEAIEAAHAEINKSWRNERWEWDAPKSAVERALRAAISTLPIAGEWKVKPLEWTKGDEGPGYHFAQSSIGNYIITEFPVVGDDQLTVRLLGTSQYGVWFKTIEEAKADAQGHLNIRILSALISSPGKDGGQEVAYRVKIAGWGEELCFTPDGAKELVQRVQNTKGPLGEATITPLYTRPQPASTALVEAVHNNREQLGEAIYRAMYQHQGGKWESVEPRHVWFEIADRLVAFLSIFPQLASPALVERLAVDTASEVNDAFDPADEALGGAFKDGFREGWLLALEGLHDREVLDEDYNRSVDMAPTERWESYRAKYFAMLHSRMER